MKSPLNSILVTLVDGSAEQQIAALEAFRAEFAAVLDTVAKAMEKDTPNRLFLAERLAGFAHKARRTFSVQFQSAAEGEHKLLCAMVLSEFGSREPLPWLLGVASQPGPEQYFVTRHLAFLGVREVRQALLIQLGSSEELGGDMVGGLLAAWKALGEQLPHELREALCARASHDIALRVALSSLGL